MGQSLGVVSANNRPNHRGQEYLAASTIAHLLAFAQRVRELGDHTRQPAAQRAKLVGGGRTIVEPAEELAQPLQHQTTSLRECDAEREYTIRLSTITCDSSALSRGTGGGGSATTAEFAAERDGPPSAPACSADVARGAQPATVVSTYCETVVATRSAHFWCVRAGSGCSAQNDT